MCVCVCVFLPEREVDSSSVDFIFLNLGEFQKFETLNCSTVNPLLVFVSSYLGRRFVWFGVCGKERERKSSSRGKNILIHMSTHIKSTMNK